MSKIPTPQPAFIQTDSREINQLQKNVVQGFSSLVANLNQCPFLTGVVLTIAMRVGVDNIALHTLGYYPTGYLVLSIDQNANVWQTGSTSQYVKLQASAVCNVTIWLF